MEADEKTRRFRAHVVQELFDTEREYTAALEFTVNVSRDPYRQHHWINSSFTAAHNG